MVNLGQTCRGPKRTYSALTLQQQNLAAEHETIARSLACKMYFASGQIGDVEDYIETAYMALIAAAALFSPQRGCFNTLLGTALKRRLWQLRAELSRKKRLRPRRFADIECDKMPSLDAADRRSYQPDQFVSIAEILARVEKELPPELWELLHARFVEGEPVRAIGIRLGMTGRCVRKQIEEALERARRAVSA